jgi:hypothetical protein
MGRITSARGIPYPIQYRGIDASEAVVVVDGVVVVVVVDDVVDTCWTIPIATSIRKTSRTVQVEL